MKRGLLTRKRLALSLPLALGAFSVLVFGGTRRLFLFNLQQIVPARAGSTFFSIWHVPECICTRDIVRPCWRRWPKEYERRKEDWRIRAARAFLPSEFWMAEETADAYDAVEDSLREYEEAIRLAPNQACLFAGKAMVLLENHACSISERLRHVNGAYVIDSEWKPSEPDATGVASIRQALEMSKKVDPNDGFSLLLEARLLFAQGKDDEAVQAVATAMSKDHTSNYGLVLSRNAEEFLSSLGVLRLEIRNMARVPTQWQYAQARVGNMLFAMGRAARTSGDHAPAVNLFRLGAYAVAAAHEERTASLSALLEISPSERTERQEDRVAAAMDYLGRHGADGLAELLKAGYEKHRRHLEDSRWVLLGAVVSWAALFGAALLLFQMVLLGLLEGTTLLIKRRGAETELPTEDRSIAHGFSACLVLAAVALGAVGCTYYIMHISSVPAHDCEPLNIAYWSLALVLFFVFANLLLPGGKVKALADFLKGWADIPRRIPARYTMLKEYSVPCALTYCGYAYVVLVWIAYFLRKWATPLL